MTISYLVHDLADPAVARRVTMLRQGGADLDLAGFRRSAAPPDQVAGVAAHDLGQTQDGRFIARILSVVKARLRVGDWGRMAGRGGSIVARNLEMLYLAAAARRRFAPDKPLFYELLDIHRLMVNEGKPGQLLRRLEGHLLRQCAGVIVSSPAFERNYLRHYYRDLPPVLLWENKVMPPHMPASGDGGALSSSLAMPSPPIAARPWRIGWFGAIRCRRSLLCLAEIARHDFRYLVASGSLPVGAPDDFLARVAEIAAGKGARFVLDCSGRGLKATLERAPVYLVKPNLDELEELVGRSLSKDAARAAATNLVAKGVAELVAVTLGAEGAILATRRGVTFRPAIKAEVQSAVGAGDSFLGAMLFALAKGWAPEEAFVFGLAGGAAALLRKGTKLCRREDVERLYGSASAERYAPA